MNRDSLRHSFVTNPSLMDRLFPLVEAAFPGMGIMDAANFIRELGASWEDASTPFIYFEDGLAISHVGVLEIPMLLMGESVTVGGIHGVCTRPEFRRRGYYRRCMEAALDYCASRYDTLVLTTSKPEFYQPFGFRVVPESAFVIKSISQGGAEGFRRLDLQVSSDRALLFRLLSEREPVSKIVGVRNEKAVFCFNEGDRPLQYAEDLDIIVDMEIEDDRLKIFDIVGKKMCGLDKILERIPQQINEIIVYFSCDRLNVDAEPFPHILDGDSWFMVRGSFPPECQPFMLPRSARC